MLDFQLARLTHVQLFGVSGGDTRNTLISAGYVLFGGGAIAMGEFGEGSPIFMRWIGAAILLAGSLPAWMLSLKRSRLVGDTPTASLRSAAQGYVEVVGTAEVCPGAQPLGTGMMPPCLWFKLKTYERERHGGKSRVRVHTRVTDDMFMLVDATGECVVDPDFAEVITTNRKWWGVADTRYEAWYLRPGEPLYVLGDLKTERSTDGALDRRGDVAALLRDWKADKADLVKRYDEDGDGQVDVQEWQKAVGDAERVVDERHGEMRLQPGIHVIRAPKRGRPLLISNRDPEELMRHYRWWSWFHLALLIGAIVYGLFLLG